MKISEFFKLGINPATSYVIGLSFPLLKIKSIDDEYFILGSVNHNSNMITDQEIAIHFMEVSKLLNQYLGTQLDMILVYNNSPIYGKLQPKQGFSIVMQLDCNDYIKEMTKMVIHLKEASEECRIQFTRGCFDGRSSFDTSRHFLSIDVDRDHQRQYIIAEVIKSLGIELDLNQREKDYDKNDQIRIIPQKLPLFMSKVGFYSVRRNNIINNYLQSC